METRTHREACAKQQAAREAYEQQWPNFCRYCDAQGYHYTPGGPGYYDPPEYDSCDFCVCQGKCPRCGQEGLDEDGNGPCTFCQWEGNDSAPASECVCWEYEMWEADYGD